MVRTLLFLLALLPVAAPSLCAEPVPVRFPTGAQHAFLLVRDEGGRVIATGDVVTTRSGSVWRERMVLRFKDGSIDDESSTFTQGRVVSVISDHHVQRGPSFPKPMDMSIDVRKKSATWHEWHDGKDEVKTETVDFPADLCNGVLGLLLQNVPTNAEETKVSYVVGMPKPRIVKFAIHPDGTDVFTVGGSSRTATKYRVHVELGGIAGVVAPLIGKDPPDIHAWVARGDVPTFLKANTFLYVDGPMWNLELSSPTWSSPRK